MKFGTVSVVIQATVALGLTSCGDDPELLRKSERQKAEISQLRSEIALFQASLEKMPADLHAQIDQSGKQQEKQAAEIERLEKEVATMTNRNQELRRQFEAYQSKYRLNQP